MTATTTSWLSRIDGCTTEQLDRMRDSLRDDLSAIHKKKRVLEEELLRLKLDISFIESNLTTLNARLNDKELTDETFDKHKHLAVTDHAALRYIERIYKINVDGIKQDIINGFPDKIPVNTECIKTGKTVYRLVKDKDRIVIVTIIRKKQ